MENKNHPRHNLKDFLEKRKANTIFEIEFGEMTCRPQSFFDESVKAAKSICHNSSLKKIGVCLSGGADSDAMVKAFLASKCEFTVFIMRMSNDLNWHETRQAVRICEKHFIPFQFIDIDVFAFFDSRRHLQYAKDYGLSSPQIAVHLFFAEKIVENFGHTPVFAGDYTTLISVEGRLNSVQWEFGHTPNPNHFAMDLHFQRLQTAVINNFFIYSPEQVASSFLLSWAISKSVKSSVQFPKNPKNYFEQLKITNSQKEDFFSRAGFKIEKRDSKWTGFEIIHEYYYQGMTGVGYDFRADSNQEIKLKGMTLFNEKYRSPMEMIAQQKPLKKIVLSDSMQKYIKQEIDQSLMPSAFGV